LYVPPPLSSPDVQWTAEDEVELEAMQLETVDLKDTQLGVATNHMAHAVEQRLELLSPTTAASLIGKIQQGVDTAVAIDLNGAIDPTRVL
jgi:hypothetical protein